MGEHSGVTCDSCKTADFKGLRFKCLKCFDFDLCQTCATQPGVPSAQGRGAAAGVAHRLHAADHPLQSIMVPTEYSKFYGGEEFDANRPLSLTCAYCNGLGFDIYELNRHLKEEHSKPPQGSRVLCPICCASNLTPDPNLFYSNLANHFRSTHENDAMRQRRAELIHMHDVRQRSQNEMRRGPSTTAAAASRPGPGQNVIVDPVSASVQMPPLLTTPANDSGTDELADPVLIPARQMLDSHSSSLSSSNNSMSINPFVGTRRGLQFLHDRLRVATPMGGLPGTSSSPRGVSRPGTGNNNNTQQGHRRPIFGPVSFRSQRPPNSSSRHHLPTMNIARMNLMETTTGQRSRRNAGVFALRGIPESSATMTQQASPSSEGVAPATTTTTTTTATIIMTPTTTREMQPSSGVNLGSSSSATTRPSSSRTGGLQCIAEVPESVEVPTGQGTGTDPVWNNIAGGGFLGSSVLLDEAMSVAAASYPQPRMGSLASFIAELDTAALQTSNYGALPAASETSSESQHPGNQREDAFQAEINRNNNSTSTDTRNNQQQRSRHQRQLAAANAAFNATQARLRATLTRHKALDDIFNVLGASCNSALAEVSKRKDARTGKSKINSPSDTRIERTVPDLFSDTRLLSGKLVNAVEQEASSRLPEQELTLRRLFVQELCLGVMLGQSPDIKRRPSESLQVAITDSDDGDGTPGNDDDVPLPIITSTNSPTAG